MALTVKQTPLKGPGGYTTNTPTLTPGAGRLKPFAAGTSSRRPSSHEMPSPYFRGRRGAPRADTVSLLKNTPRTLLDQPEPPPPEEE
jgi:hypothetical protein